MMKIIIIMNNNSNRDIVCLRNVSINILHKGDDDDNNVECESKSDTSDSRGNRNHLKIVLTKSEQRTCESTELRNLKKKVILGTVTPK